MRANEKGGRNQVEWGRLGAKRQVLGCGQDGTTATEGKDRSFGSLVSEAEESALVVNIRVVVCKKD